MDDTKATIRLAEQQGWEVSKTRGGHLKFQGPDGGPIFSGSTPGDHRGRIRHRARLRKAGLRLSARQDSVVRPRKESKEGNALTVLQTLQKFSGQPMPFDKLSELTHLTPAQTSGALHDLRAHPEIRNIGKNQVMWMPPRLDEATPEGYVDFEPAVQSDGNGNGNGNGHAPEPSTAVEPLVAVSTSVPDDAPQLFEFICLDNHGLPVLRDERGRMWLAAPMLPKF